MSTFTDIYKLCNNKTIKVVITNSIKSELNKRINLLRNKNIKLKQIAKLIGVRYTTLWDYLNRKNSIPLEVFTILNIKLPKHITLESGPRRNKVYLPLNLTEEISKVIGAIIADGHLRRRATKWNENKNAIHYETI